MITLANGTAAQRGVWVARVRDLEAAGFSVQIVGGNNSAPVYLVATCR